MHEDRQSGRTGRQAGRYIGKVGRQAGQTDKAGRQWKRAAWGRGRHARSDPSLVKSGGKQQYESDLPGMIV